MNSIKVCINTYLTALILISACHGDDLSMERIGQLQIGQLQYSENPPMQIITRDPPLPSKPTKEFEILKGYTLISTMKEFRAVIQKSNQKIRVKPGVYRAKTVDPPINLPLKAGTPGVGRNREKGQQQHIFAVNGSNNSFDLRGVVFETPVSLQSKLTRKVHVSDSWRVNGAQNTFVGGYFRNIIDMSYPTYNVTGNEFEVLGDGNRFVDCIFVIKGSVPYGYTDFYGKGSGSYGRLNKHSFMSIDHANDTQLIRCQVYQQSFGHCVHFHNVDGALIKDCFFTGTLRPTNDIFKEIRGRAVDHDFNMLFRKKQPIPRDHMIPLTEDGIRSYNDVKNITVINTTIERMRGAVQLLCTGDVTLENVTVLESGDFSYDVSASKGSKIIMKNCRSDVAYNPVFNLTRGEIPSNANYEITLLSPPEGAEPTARTNLGIICGEQCHFTLREDLQRPLAEKVNFLTCGGRNKLVHSQIDNYTKAKLVLEKNVMNCTIQSIGPVEDKGGNNKIIQLSP
ncbi:MAG: hypothetical protein ACSHX0_09550 [Akkermansiaceae bacterium]